MSSFEMIDDSADDSDVSRELCPACDEFLCRIPPSTECSCGMNVPMMHRSGCEYCGSLTDVQALLFDPWEPSPYELQARKAWFSPLPKDHADDCWCGDCTKRYTLTRGGEDHCAKMTSCLRLPFIGLAILLALAAVLAVAGVLATLVVKHLPAAFEAAANFANFVQPWILRAFSAFDIVYVMYFIFSLSILSGVGYMWHVLYERAPVLPSLPFARVEEVEVKRDAVIVPGADEASVAYPRYLSMAKGEWPKGVFLLATKDGEKIVQIGMGDCVKVHGQRYLKFAAHELEASGWFDRENPAFVIAKNGMVSSLEFKICKIYPKPLDLVVARCVDDSVYSRLGLGSNEVGHVPKHGSAVGYTYRFFPLEGIFKKSYGALEVIEGGFVTTCDTTNGMSGSPLIYNGKSVGNHLGAAVKEGFNRGVSCSFMLRKRMKAGPSRDESDDYVRYANDWADTFQKYADAYDDYSDDEYEPWFDDAPVPWEQDLYLDDFEVSRPDTPWGGVDESGNGVSPTGVGVTPLNDRKPSIVASQVFKETITVTVKTTAPLKLDESAVVTPEVAAKPRSSAQGLKPSKASSRRAKKRAQEDATLLEIKEVVANAKTLGDVKAFVKSSQSRDTKPATGPKSKASNPRTQSQEGSK